MANIYDEFTLQNLAGIPAAMNRIGATKAAIAQDAFLNQRAVQQSEQERRARNAAAIDLSRIEQQLRDISNEKTRKAQTEESLKIFDIEQKAREASQIDAEERRARMEVKAIGERANAIEKAHDEILAAKEPQIRSAWDKIEEERAAENTQIERAIAAIKVTPEQITARFLASQEGQAEISKLSAEQQALIRGGQVATVIQKLGPKKSGGLARVLDEARNQLEADAIDRRKQLVDVMQDQIKARPFNSDAQARMLMTRYPGAEKFRPQRLAPAESQESNEKKAGLPKRAVGALSPEETGFFPELYGGKQAGGAAGYVPGIIPNAFNAVRDIPANIASGVASSDAGLAVSDVVRALQNKYANARTSLFGGVPQPAPVSSGALSRLMPTVNPSQSIMARTAGAFMPSQANVFNLLRQLGLSTPGSTPPATVSPWQTGAEAFMIDPRMQAVNPFAPQVATEIPEGYFSIGR